MKLYTHIAGVKLQHPIYNASGINNEILPQLIRIAETDTSAVLLKSCTIEPRKGNENPKYIVKSSLLPGGTLNSMGLPNKGLKANLDFVRDLKENPKTKNKPIIASLSGLTINENLEMLNEFQTQGLADLIEINLSCPNIGQHRLVGYDPKQTTEIVNGISKIKGNIPVGVKFPPFLETHYYDEMTQILLDSSVKFVVCSNTLGNAMAIDIQKESVLIKPNQGQGGLGGDYLKPIALSNVFNFYQRLTGKIDIIGVGGVRSGEDVFRYILAGASAVQVGTGFAQEGPSIFTKIKLEFEEIMKTKGYSEISDFQGKLKIF